MAASDTIGVGFIGAGDISILHARAVAKCPGAKLVGLWNRSQDRARSEMPRHWSQRVRGDANRRVRVRRTPSFHS